MRYQIHTELNDSTIDEKGAATGSKRVAVTVARRCAQSPAWDATAYLVYDTKAERYVYTAHAVHRD